MNRPTSPASSSFRSIGSGKSSKSVESAKSFRDLSKRSIGSGSDDDKPEQNISFLLVCIVIAVILGTFAIVSSNTDVNIICGILTILTCIILYSAPLDYAQDVTGSATLKEQLAICGGNVSEVIVLVVCTIHIFHSIDDVAPYISLQNGTVIGSVNSNLVFVLPTCIVVGMISMHGFVESFNESIVTQFDWKINLPNCVFLTTQAIITLLFWLIKIDQIRGDSSEYAVKVINGFLMMFSAVFYLKTNFFKSNEEKPVDQVENGDIESKQATVPGNGEKDEKDEKDNKVSEGCGWMGAFMSTLFVGGITLSYFVTNIVVKSLGAVLAGKIPTNFSGQYIIGWICNAPEHGNGIWWASKTTKEDAGELASAITVSIESPAQVLGFLYPVMQFAVLMKGVQMYLQWVQLLQIFVSLLAVNVVFLDGKITMWKAILLFSIYVISGVLIFLGYMN